MTKIQNINIKTPDAQICDDLALATPPNVQKSNQLKTAGKPRPLTAGHHAPRQSSAGDGPAPRAQGIPKERGKYLYCIIKGKVPENKFQLKGLEEKDIKIINEGKFSFVMSDASQSEYPLWREHILAHQGPMQEIMKYYDILPFSFSNIADTEEQVKQKVLKERSKELEELSQKFKGKIELGLKAVWSDLPTIFQEIARNSPELQRLKRSPRLTYQQQMAAGELVERLLKNKRALTAEKILEAFKPLAEDHKEMPLIGQNMILNAAFLVKRRNEKKFYREVAELAQQCSGVRFHYSGPFPLYNFISLRLNI